MNSFEQQMVLVDLKLAQRKDDGKYTTFKYARKAMYDYLWFDVPSLMECRGHVYDTHTQEIVQAAPRKSFNYLECGWWDGVPLDTSVKMFKKINGYMACATIHDGELVVSTTGSTTSEYANWAMQLLKDDIEKFGSDLDSEHTTLFEVVVPQDPHIVDERMGLHMLGYRNKKTSVFTPYGNSFECSLSDALALAEEDTGEGFMVYKEGVGFDDCCKIKTPYYIGKKKLMRMTKKNVDLMYNNTDVFINMLPDMWKHVPELIVWDNTHDEWLEMSAQDRRKYLEGVV